MMRRVLVFASALAFFFTTVTAQESSHQTLPSTTVVYLPAIQSEPALPPMPADIVLDLSELPSDYAIEDEAIVTNEDAASNYDNPAAALQIFQAQGRETAYVRDFVHPDAFKRAVRFGEQVTRFLTPEGAMAGQDAFVQRDEAAGYTATSFPDMDGRTVALRRSFTSSGYTFFWYTIIVQRGRFILETYALIGSAEADVAVVVSLTQQASQKLVRFVPHP